MNWKRQTIAAVIGVAVLSPTGTFPATAETAVPKPRPAPEDSQAPMPEGANGGEEIPRPDPRLSVRSEPPEGTGRDGELPAASGRRGTGREEDDEAVVVMQPAFDLAEAKICERGLAAAGVRFKVLPALREDNGCGSPRPLEVTAVGAVLIDPPATLRCPVAQALADWVERVVIPSARLYLNGERPAALFTASSYQCRQRSGNGGTGFSEHAAANAVDIAGFGYEARDDILIRDRDDPADGALAFQAAIRGGACAIFTTVIGPSSDPDHADHLHLDLAERTSGYRVCE